MPRRQIWLSIALWATLALAFSIGVSLLLNVLYPTLDMALRGLAAFLSVNVVYMVRAGLRRRGWAITSYAQPER
ncbi:hypothetical protein C8J32_101697 [Rhizobium sp. PP-CC-3A-592]|nr:hypothetical protein C8J32_101697 [Rhizobium sp. PP-CC-3A-592]